MDNELFAAVDAYISNLVAPEDDVLLAVQQSARAAGLPDISVSPSEGKFLHVLALLCNAKRILEIGTLAGYSAIWMARALPRDGKLVTIEFDPAHADEARANFTRAGLQDRISLRVGKALEVLPRLQEEGEPPFDMIFIDADKPGNPEYFSWALKLSRRGSVIIVDNVVRDGAVADAASRDPSMLGVRRLNELIASEPRVSATAIQTVGSKGYDGFALILLTGGP